MASDSEIVACVLEASDAAVAKEKLSALGAPKLRVMRALKRAQGKLDDAIEDIELSNAEDVRLLVYEKTDRLAVIRCMQVLDRDDDPIDMEEILAEWDAINFPKQLPAPVREAALKRLAENGIFQEVAK